MKISPPPNPSGQCPGCGALHALVDRLTVATEALEAVLPRLLVPPLPEPPWRVDTDRSGDGEAA